MNKGMIKSILICVAIIGILVVISRGILVQPFKPISEHATKFGRLFPYTPKASFKHFKTEDGYQVDFIYRRKDNKYQFLSKSKIK